MSTAALIIGESGSGKSTSMRNMNPSETLLIQTIKKPLPFRSKDWKRFDQETCKNGNVFVTDNHNFIIEIMKKTRRKIIIIDDFQYLLANEFMRRSDERGYDKFTDLAKHAWEVISIAMQMPDDVRVYILSHSHIDDHGKTRFKTIGKMLDEKIVVEGLVSIVLNTYKDASTGKHYFDTEGKGMDTVKTPMGMFEEPRIDNDLLVVDQAIKQYYEVA